MIDDRVTLDARVRRGDPLERENGRTSKRGHELELDAMLLWDLVPELGPHLYKRGDIGLVEGRERCLGVLRLLYAFRDAQAHAVQSYCPEQWEASSIRESIPSVWTGVGRVSSQSLVGGVLLSALMVAERGCLWDFQPPGHQLSEDPRGRSRLGVWRPYLWTIVRKIGAWSLEVHTCGA